VGTLSEAVDRIKADLVISGTVYDSQIKEALRSALRSLRGKRYWFLRGTYSLTLTEGDSYETLPTDFSVPDKASYVAQGMRYSDKSGFNTVPYQKLVYDHYSVIQTGQPVSCAYNGDKIYFSHVADTNYTIDLEYFTQDSTLPTADADATVWGDEGYDVWVQLGKIIFKRASAEFNPSQADDNMLAFYTSQLDTQHENRFTYG